MSLKVRLLLLLAVLVTTTMGCHLVENPKSATRRMTRMFTPNPTDWDSKSAEDAGQWDFVGDEGRAEQVREKDPDPWFKKYLMSEKANSIERNLGID
jgi:hypothetical protein